jgi:hypothetical protein
MGSTWLRINVHQWSTPMTFAYDIRVSVQNSCETDVNVRGHQLHTWDHACVSL